jgi:glutathione S-transferase
MGRGLDAVLAPRLARRAKQLGAPAALHAASHHSTPPPPHTPLPPTPTANGAEPDLLRALKRDLAALDALLGPGPYLLGAKPCFADATLFGMLDTALHDGVPNPCVRDAIAACPNLARFAADARARWFPERGPGAGGDGAGAADGGKL